MTFKVYIELEDGPVLYAIEDTFDKAVEVIENSNVPYRFFIDKE